MADGVVHVLEAIEVEQRNRGRPIVCVRVDQPFELVLQGEPVGEAGKLVVMRQMTELPFGLLAVGDVLAGPGDTPDAAVGVVHRRGRQADVDQRAVLAAALGLDVADGLAVHRPFEQPRGQLHAVGWNDLDGLPEHLFGGITEDLLGGTVPHDEKPLRVGAHDRDRR